MNLPSHIHGLRHAAFPGGPVHLAIGMFDGVHLGHRAVIDAAVQSARTSGGTSAVLTFWPHPSTLFRPENPTRTMHDAETKARLLQGLGVDVVVTERFDAQLASIAAESFLGWLREHLPQLAGIYVGENFRFGQQRRGDVDLLVEHGRATGVQVFSAPRVNLNGEPVSSTRVRAQLASGDIEAANALLGYAYFAEGVVTGGKRLGRTIGFPTLNVPWVPELLPRLGVYAMRVSGEKSSAGLPAVANYGVRPTVEHGQAPRIEAHVLGPCPFDEGDRVRLEWLRFLRPEMRFAGLEELRAQIAQDRAAAEKFFAS